MIQERVTYIRTLTTAPDDYDGFGTRTVRIAGWLQRTDREPEEVRLVETPEEHVDWQRGRYSSGIYLVNTPEQWRKTVDANMAVAKP
jgi:hypothetical protein